MNLKIKSFVGFISLHPGPLWRHFCFQHRDPQFSMVTLAQQCWAKVRQLIVVTRSHLTFPLLFYVPFSGVIRLLLVLNFHCHPGNSRSELCTQEWTSKISQRGLHSCQFCRSSRKALDCLPHCINEWWKLVAGKQKTIYHLPCAVNRLGNEIGCKTNRGRINVNPISVRLTENIN